MKPPRQYFSFAPAALRAAGRAARCITQGWLWMLLLTPACLWAHGSHQLAAPTEQVTASATAVSDQAPDWVARFRVSFSAPGRPPQTQTWQLSRTATEIAWIKGHGIEEIWRRDRSGIRLERVLRADRHSVAYSAGELRTLGVMLDWRDLGSLFSEPDLAQLQRAPQRQSRGSQQRDAPQHYRGKLAGEQIDLVWDPLARLPVQLVRQGKTGRVVYQRLASLPIAPADWPRPGSGTDDFAHLDAADFGDMDSNPVVRQEQARDERAGWRRAHHET